MLRPATPLSVLLLVAFALLLLSVLSAPVIKSIPLGTFQDVTFGFLGYCSADGCSAFGLGYGNVEDIVPGSSADFTLSPSVRNTLSAILVLHPVAAFLTLVALIMTLAAHTHSLSHSSRYMLLLFLLLFIDFLVCAAAFVVDLLLFLPHQAWGTYIVLGAAVIVFFSAVGTCAVRRHMIRRKSFRRRSRNNSEIGGDDYYNIQNLVPKPGTFATGSQPTVPVISGANMSPDSLPAFATFEPLRKEEGLSDEQFPLTMRTTSERSAAPTYRSDEDMPPAGAVGVALSGPTRSNSQDPYRPHMNNQNPPYGPARGMPYGRMNRGSYRGPNPGYHHHQQQQQQPMRGPGGMPPRGGPAYGPRGGRGGYGPPPRGAYGPTGVMRTEGRTPPLTHILMAEPFDSRPPPEQQAPYRTQSPQDYDRRSDNHSPGVPTRTYTPYSPDRELPRAPSPPPVHDSLPEDEKSQPSEHPIELDATPAGPSSTPSPIGHARGGETDAPGPHALHTQHIPELPEIHAVGEPDATNSDQFVPARAEWSQSAHSESPNITPPPPNAQTREDAGSQEQILRASPTHSGGYYEDVDPRFDQSHSRGAHTKPSQHAEDGSGLNRERSVAESEYSNFTSISQRDINPQWEPRPPLPQAPYTGRQPPQQRHDMILDNPNFSVPGARAGPPRPRAPGGGMTPGSAYPTGPI